MVELSLEQAFMRADFHIERGEVSEARKFYQAILSAVPNNERAQQALNALQEEELPKKIYSLWFQGVENLPVLIERNFKQWRKLNPEYELIVLDETSCIPYLKHLQIDYRKISMQAKSDIIRLQILKNKGGIWVDASVFPIKPLEEWIGVAMQKADFFAFEGNQVSLPISSWFLIAKPNSKILKFWNELVTAYWSVLRPSFQGENRDVFHIPKDLMSMLDSFNATEPSPHPYFWVHHLFAILLQTNPEFREEWGNCFKSSSMDVHRYARHFYSMKKNGLKEGPRPIVLIASDTPMQKLDWRENYPANLFKGF